MLNMFQVLRFSSHDHLQKFCSKLNTYVYDNGKLMVRQPASWKSISKKAVTKSRRKENLNSFFRNVFAQVGGCINIPLFSAR